MKEVGNANEDILQAKFIDTSTFYRSNYSDTESIS